jgi:hypothetical protein
MLANKNIKRNYFCSYLSSILLHQASISKYQFISIFFVLDFDLVLSYISH